MDRRLSGLDPQARPPGQRRALSPSLSPGRVRPFGLPLLILGLSACAEPTRPPDVILISLDSVRADALTFVDSGTTPSLARLAEGGTIFTRAVSGSSWTLPAHAQMFTGQPPALHGVQNDERRIDPLTRTLPECLAEQGYMTAGFWSGWFLSGAYGFERGFDRYEGALALPSDGEERDPQATRAQFIARENSSHQQITSERILELATAAIEGVPDEVPLFLFAHFFDPHYDYVPPAPFDTRFDPDYAGTIDGRDFWNNKAIFDAQRNPRRRIDERGLEHIRALYQGELAWTDRILGKLFDRLEADGRLENALILVTADHGEEFFEHGNRGHRQGLYEEVIRVPLLIVRTGTAAEGRERVARETSLVSLSDLMPTILDYVGADVPRSVWGSSLRAQVEGRASAEHGQRLVLSTLASTEPGEDGGATLVMDSLHGGAFKLIREVRIPVGGPPELQALSWFDLATDRDEQHPRRKVSRPDVASAWGRLEREMERMRAFHAALPHSALDERTTDVSEVFSVDLGSLGYAEGSDAPAPDSEASWTLEPLPALRPPSSGE